ncbi:unnamed protein product [Alopecurus aequalis]
MIAVKKLNNMQGMDDKQFLNEVKLVMDISHPNIVRAEGYCYHIEKELMPFNESYVLVDKVYRLLCFEYLPHGSLDKHLSDESFGLEWHVRYNIIHGICKGLYCLHESRPGAPILHLDLKPANVLLDEHMIPKIADFGQSRLFGEGETHCSTMNIVGTRGYMAPEYIDKGTLTKESDIYSLGVILMEILTGDRKHPENTTAREFSEVKGKWRKRLQTTLNRTSLEEECRQINLCIRIGLKCMERDPKKRPNIKEIVEILGLHENMNSQSIQEDGSDVEEQSWEVVPLEWREALDTVALRSPEQSIKGMEVIFHELLRIFETESIVPRYIIKDADRLILYLSAMAEKTSRLILSGATSMSVVYFAGRLTINTLTQAFNIRDLANAVKVGTLGSLLRDILIWSIVNKDVELSKLIKILIWKIQENANRISLLLVFMNLLRPLDLARWPSCANPVPLEDRTHLYSELVAECLDVVAKNFLATVGESDLDRVLASIQNYLEELGVEEITKREESKDSGLVAVMDVLAELVHVRGPLIKNHHSMVRVDADRQPIILAYIDSLLKDEGGASSANPKVEGGKHGQHKDEAGTSSVNPKIEDGTEGQYEARVTRLGPWGAGGGAARDVNAEPRYLNSITIRSDGLIISLSFSYIDEEGKPRHGGTWGSKGGRLAGIVNTIHLGPSEFLTQISGTVGLCAEFSSDVVTSLTFMSNESTYGPFGRDEGTRFRSPALTNKSIVGFFVRSGAYVDAVGVYVKHGRETMIQEISTHKIGPWGGHAGEAYDMEKLPKRLISVLVYTSNRQGIASIAFTYIDCNGEQRTDGPWGRKKGLVNRTADTISLGASEFLHQVSGTIDRCEGYDIVTSIRFVTNVSCYGPFGREGGVPFHSPELRRGRSIIGFFANGWRHLNGIGVYVG